MFLSSLAWTRSGSVDLLVDHVLNVFPHGGGSEARSSSLDTVNTRTPARDLVWRLWFASIIVEAGLGTVSGDLGRLARCCVLVDLMGDNGLNQERGCHVPIWSVLVMARGYGVVVGQLLSLGHGGQSAHDLLLFLSGWDVRRLSY